MQFLRRLVATWWKGLLLSLVVALGIGEIVARRIDPEKEFITRKEWENSSGQRLTTGEDLRGKTVRWIGRVGNRREYQQDIYTNAFGFHDREHGIAKAPGVRRVLVVGDSFVEAWQVAMEDAMPRRLESTLRSNGLAVEVIAAGRSGWGSIEYRAAIQEWAPRLAADTVVWCFCPANDVRNASQAGTRLQSEQEKSPLGELWRRRESPQLPGLLLPASALNRILARAASDFARRRAVARCDFPYKVPIDFYVYAGRSIAFVEEGWDRTFDDLRATRSFLAERGVSFVVVSATDRLRMAETDEGPLEALRRDYPAARDETWNFDLPEARLGGFLATESIPYVGLQATFRARFQEEHLPYHFLSDGHWNERGHDWAARELAGPVARAMRK